jgi:type I restriction enzyme, R subunit
MQALDELKNLRAQLRVLVKRILRKVRLPAGELERTTQMVLEQAEALSAEWAA